jgi:S1-C subfamily serine protease
MSSSVLETLSNELATAAEAVGKSVVAVHARRWLPSSGVYWRKGVVVTSHHAIRHAEEITLVGDGGKQLKAALAGRDPSTDLAILKLADGSELPIPPFADSAPKLGHVVLALGRSRNDNLVASAGIIGGVSGEWRTPRGGRLDQHIRLSLELYPGFSGGPLVNAQGKVLGINTRGLARGRALTLSVATVNRVVDELLEKGHIARPYLGLAMQPVSLPESLRSKVASAVNSALLVVHVEPSGPADKAGVLLGDLVTELRGKPVQDTENIRELLGSDKPGDSVAVAVLRGGAPMKLSITLGELPVR